MNYSEAMEELVRQVLLTARHGYQGFTGLANMVADPAVGIANQLGANLQLPSQAESAMLTRAGLPEPQTDREKLIGAVTRGMSGAGTGYGLAGAVKPTTTVGRDFAELMAARPVAQTVAGGLSGGAGEATMQTTGSPTAAMAAGVLAGAVPMIVPGPGGSGPKQFPAMTGGKVEIQPGYIIEALGKDSVIPGHYRFRIQKPGASARVFNADSWDGATRIGRDFLAMWNVDQGPNNPPWAAARPSVPPDINAPPGTPPAPFSKPSVQAALDVVNAPPTRIDTGNPLLPGGNIDLGKGLVMRPNGPNLWVVYRGEKAVNAFRDDMRNAILRGKNFAMAQPTPASEAPVPPLLHEPVRATMAGHLQRNVYSNKPMEAGEILAQRMNNTPAGFTVDVNGEMPSHGYAVAAFPDRGLRDVKRNFISPDEIIDFARHNAFLLKKPGNFVGGWADKEGGAVYLDIARVFSNRAEAEAMGKRFGEIAIFDLGQKKEIRLNYSDAERAAAAQNMSFGFPKIVTLPPGKHYAKFSEGGNMMAVGDKAAAERWLEARPSADVRAVDRSPPSESVPSPRFHDGMEIKPANIERIARNLLNQEKMGAWEPAQAEEAAAAVRAFGKGGAPGKIAEGIRGPTARGWFENTFLKGNRWHRDWPRAGSDLPGWPSKMKTPAVPSPETSPSSSSSAPSSETGPSQWSRSRQNQNVRMWIQNDEGLHYMAREARKGASNTHEAASNLYDWLNGAGISRTPDGVPYDVRGLVAAMEGMSGPTPSSPGSSVPSSLRDLSFQTHTSLLTEAARGDLQGLADMIEGARHGKNWKRAAMVRAVAGGEAPMDVFRRAHQGDEFTLNRGSEVREPIPPLAQAWFLREFLPWYNQRPGAPAQRPRATPAGRWRGERMQTWPENAGPQPWQLEHPPGQILQAPRLSSTSSQPSAEIQASASPPIIRQLPGPVALRQPGERASAPKTPEELAIFARENAYLDALKVRDMKPMPEAIPSDAYRNGERIGHGIHNPKIVDVNGKKAFVKRAEDGSPVGELAAYEAQAILGIRRVAVRAEEIDGNMAIVKPIIKGATEIQNFFGKLDPKASMDLFAFDMLGDVRDRHHQNFMIDPKGKPIGIDFDSAFGYFPLDDSYRHALWDMLKSQQKEADASMFVKIVDRRKLLEHRIGGVNEKPDYLENRIDVIEKKIVDDLGLRENPVVKLDDLQKALRTSGLRSRLGG